MDVTRMGLSAALVVGVFLITIFVEFASAQNDQSASVDSNLESPQITTLNFTISFVPNSSESIDKVIPLEWYEDGDAGEFLIVKYHDQSTNRWDFGKAEIDSGDMTTLSRPDDVSPVADAINARIASDGKSIFMLWNNTIFQHDLTTMSYSQVFKADGLADFDTLPNGNLLYATIGSENYVTLYIGDNTGQTAEKLMINGSYYDDRFIDVSPDGKHLAYRKTLSSNYWSTENGLFVYDLESKQEKQLPTRLYYNCGDPVRWSPNSQYIVYHDIGCSRFECPCGNILLIDMNGNSEQLIPTTDDRPSGFAISPDGQKIVFSSKPYERGLGIDYGNSHAYIVTLARPIPELDGMAVVLAATALGVIFIISKTSIKSVHFKGWSGSSSRYIR